MKNSLFTSILVLVVLSTICSCSNDFELTEDWKSIPVVYGFLSPKDTATYIRVEKAYLDEASAFKIAQIPDSLYYKNIVVKLTGNGNSYTLNRVDGNEEGYIREAGIFANTPNYLYKLILPSGVSYEDGKEYTLTVDREDGTNITEVETTIVPSVEFKPPFPTSWTWNNAEAQNKSTVRWKYFEPAQVFDIVIAVNYSEEINGVVTSKKVEFVLEKGIKKEDNNSATVLTQDIRSVDVFKGIASAVDASTGNGPRYFSSLTIMIDAADGEILKYNEVGDANTGLTGGSAPPTYTNIENGYGIFASRNRTRLEENTILTNGALDSLKFGRFTKHLNFQ